MTLALRVALVEPEIAPNTGAIARLCVATGASLHLIGRLGFQLDDRRLKRAGLDYWEHARVERHEDFEAFLAGAGRPPTFFFSAHATRPHWEARYPPGAALVFGSETRGLPARLLADRERCWTIPIRDRRVRSLNLATAVGIALYEAVRQSSSPGADSSP